MIRDTKKIAFWDLIQKSIKQFSSNFYKILVLRLKIKPKNISFMAYLVLNLL